MGQISPFLRRGTDFHSWYCPGCREMHTIPDGAGFSGSVDVPSWARPIEHRAPLGGYTRFNALQGWPCGLCSYRIDAGQVTYFGDATHDLRGMTIPMPELQAERRDQA